MFRFAVIGMAAIALAGCQSVSEPQIEAQIPVAVQRVDAGIAKLSKYCAAIEVALGIGRSVVTGPKTSAALAKADQVFSDYCAAQPTNVGMAASAAVNAVARLQSVGVPTNPAAVVSAAQLAR